MIFIGLGAGRTGTASLTRLLNSQYGAVCFHELNPTCAHFSENFAPIKNTINEFSAILNGGDNRLLTIDYSRKMSIQNYYRLKAIAQPKLLGDIAFYYLSYVEEIHALNPDVRFLCLYRDKASNVQSWLKKTKIRRWLSLWFADWLHALIMREPFYREYNFWQEHDGSIWAKDPVWDKNFPKFKASSKQQAIEMYWDFYYSEAERLANLLPGHFKIIDIKQLNALDGQKEVLAFLGFAEHEMTLLSDCHLHKSFE